MYNHKRGEQPCVNEYSILIRDVDVENECTAGEQPHAIIV